MNIITYFIDFFEKNDIISPAEGGLLMEEVIFIDPNGNIIQYDNICSHVGVAAKLISENEELKQRYQESGCRVPNMFLISLIISVCSEP